MRTPDTSRQSHLPTFVAIDFETADYGRDSACAVAVVRVEGLAIVDRAHYYIRPPRSRFVFSYRVPHACGDEPVSPYVRSTSTGAVISRAAIVRHHSVRHSISFR
jgi:DNA polymerase III epsilon subunit-like protein